MGREESMSTELKMALGETKDVSVMGAEFTTGDLGFDPLSLYSGKPEQTRRALELKELNNGRLAMLAITYYAAAEILTEAVVVDATPFLFKSIL